MTTAVNSKRVAVEEILTSIVRDGDGEVYADDIAAIMAVLGFSGKSAVLNANKVSNTVDDVVEARKIAEAFRDDPRSAAWKYAEGGRVNPAFLDSTIEAYELEAERGVNLLIGLSALA